MKWIGITGSWRRTNKRIERDVQAAVEQIFSNGNGLVTGGALGVDYIATEVAIRRDPRFEKTKVILPTTLEIYAAHFRQRATEKVITSQQAEQLIVQLTHIQSVNPTALIEMLHTHCNPKTYYARNTRVVQSCAELLAFQVNDSEGTQDTIDKAEAAGKPVTLKRYTLK